MDLKQTASALEQTLVASHLNDVRLLAQEGSSERLGRIYSVLTRLSHQPYLVGTGPYTTGIYRLSMEETVIGRMASPLEESAGKVIDIPVNDWITLTPREVSRVHAKVAREEGEGGAQFRLIDLESRLGTYVNGRRLGGEEGAEEATHVLEHGDLISLGPSHINTFMFVVIRGEEVAES